MRLLIVIVLTTLPSVASAAEFWVDPQNGSAGNDGSEANPWSTLQDVQDRIGSDVQGGVHRKTRADVFSAPPLPPAEFELSDWRFIHADPHVFIVSYRVKGLSFPWEAYATSVWVHRDGRWQTVFYQATTAK